MTTEEKLSQEIINQFGEKYNLKDVEIKVVIQEKSSKPSELSPNGGVVEFVGKIGEYFIYLVKEGYKKIRFICTLISIVKLFTVYVPDGYDFVSQYGKQLLAGDTTVVQEKGKEDNGFLVFKNSWVNDPGSFNQDHSNFEKGNYGTLNSDGFTFYSASGVNTVISNGTSSIDLSKS